jgi:hypothetical protein
MAETERLARRRVEISVGTKLRKTALDHHWILARNQC